MWGLAHTVKQYIVVILITLHLINANLYATKSILEKNHFVNSNICSIYEHPEEHEHEHYHNGYKHTHSHNHSQINMSFADFYTYLQYKSQFDYLIEKQTFLEKTAFIPNPILESLFRPPRA